MLQIVQRTIRQHDLIPSGAHLLLAVSGGADSTALAVALAALRRRHRWRLTLAHLHHGIRGAEADADAQFVRRLAGRLKAGFVTEKIEVPRLARRRRVSLEMAAREARYAFLTRAARRVGAEVIATAHTADDQAETILLRLARGAGPRGLAGIPYRVMRHDRLVVRPLLDVTRRQVERFLKKRGLAWREDTSNLDLGPLRNRVRHEILPQWEARLNPNVRETLRRMAEVLREEDDWMDAEARRRLDTFRIPGHPRILNAAALRAAPPALARRVIRIWLSEASTRSGSRGTGIAPEHNDFDTVERVWHLAASLHGTRAVPVNGSMRVVRQYEKLACEPVRPLSQAAFRKTLRVPGTTVIPSAGWRFVVRRGCGYVPLWDVPPTGPLMEAWVDAARVGRARLVARSWRAGDRIRPLGLGGSKKIQDLFVDLKIPREQRAKVPVIECRGQIVWVPGSRVSRDWVVRGPHATFLHLQARPEPDLS